MLIRCPECGKEISDKATACPFCGCPKSEWAMKDEPAEKNETGKMPESDSDEAKNVFPFCVTKYDVFSIHLRCNRCGNSFETDPGNVKTELDRISFPNGMTCAQCGTFVGAGSFYEEDRSSIIPKSQARPIKRGKEPSIETISCPHCGCQNSKLSQICYYCGGDLKASPSSVPADRGARKCSKCGGDMTVQVVTEQKKTGCFTVLFYIILALTVIGLLIVIPLALRKKTETVTYAVCQVCGRKVELNRT